MSTKLPLIALILLGSAMTWSACVAPSREPQGEWRELRRVRRVIDGDTVVLQNGERVRLVGVDAFEIRRGPRLKAQAKAAGITEDEALRRGLAEASALRRRIEGKEVWLRFRLYPRDRYGRILGELE